MVFGPFGGVKRGAQASNGARWIALIKSYRICVLCAASIEPASLGEPSGGHQLELEEVERRRKRFSARDYVIKLTGNYNDELFKRLHVSPALTDDKIDG